MTNKHYLEYTKESNNNFTKGKQYKIVSCLQKYGRLSFLVHDDNGEKYFYLNGNSEFNLVHNGAPRQWRNNGV